ncbi:hypothetical protein G7Z13_22900 [Streptomyces sp. JB150]|nr:hypothetical protein G7Z13_22900 [Streptomyces sp. JB150]
MLWTLALGLWGLSRQGSVWRDEAATWQVARRSTAEICHLLENVDVVHGCYYLLMHLLFSCFGAGTTTLRLPSVLAMAVAAGCLAVTGRRLAGARAGTAAGLALGLLPAVQFHLQEGRPYALVAAGAGVCTLLLVTALRRPVRARHWLAYGCALALAGLLNWLALLIVPAHLATLLLSRAGRGVRIRWTAAAATATLCVLPLVLFSRTQSRQVSWIPPLTWHTLVGPAVLLAIAGACALVARPRTARVTPVTVGLPLLVVPHLGLAGLSLVQPLFVDRYILYSLLGLALLVGAAVDTAARALTRRNPAAARRLLPVVLALATIALLPQSLAKRSPESRVDDVMAIAADVRRVKQPGDAVLFLPAARRDTQSVSPGSFSGLRDVALRRTPEESGTLKGVEAGPERIRAALLGHRRVLLVTDAAAVARPVTAERERVKSSVLSTYFRPVYDEETRGRRLTVYERLERRPVPGPVGIRAR